MADDPSAAREATRVCIGVVTGAHGVKGLVRIKPFTEAPEAVAAYGAVETEDGRRRFEITLANRIGKGQVAVRIVGIADRDAAEALKGQRLYVQRSRLPATEPDEFYHADLIGLAAQRSDGTRIGMVRAVYDFGAGDVLEVVDDAGALLMVPFTSAAVPEVDVDGGFIVVAEAALADAEREIG